MIVVDTSVWVGVRRQPGGELSRTLEALLDADEVALALPVRVELYAGTAKADRRAFQRAFSALPLLVPSEDTWAPLATWVERAGDAGERFAFTDLIIARLADEVGGLVWSLDKDFVRMAELGFVQLYG